MQSADNKNNGYIDLRYYDHVMPIPGLSLREKNIMACHLLM